MYSDIIRSKLGLVATIVVGTLVSINGTRVDESILKKNISTPTILIIEGLIVLSAILLTVAFVPKMRSKTISDMKKITIGDITRLGLYALIGIAVAFIVNDALVHHGTDEVKLYQIIIGLLITGLIYFLSTNKKLAPKKIVFFIVLSIFAVLFSME